MKEKITSAICVTISIAVFIFSAETEVFAHGGGNWNPFRIDRVNSDAQTRLLQLQQELSALLRGRSEAAEWPMPELQRLRDDLLSVKEEVDEVLEHYVSDGANLQLAENLRADPRMGRTAAASRALEAAVGLIGHAATLDSQEAFVKEFYARGLVAYLYELIEAHKDRMDLYGELMASVEQAGNSEE